MGRRNANASAQGECAVTASIGAVASRSGRAGAQSRCSRSNARLRLAAAPFYVTVSI
jgi:hypothetical protein